MWLKVVLVLLTAACTSGESSVQSDSAITLQMSKKTIDGQERAALLLCQGNTCLNPLRGHDGREFYFYDHADAYNSATKSLLKGQGVKLALLGVSVIAGGFGIYYLFKGWKLHKQLSDVKFTELEKTKEALDGEAAAVANPLKGYTDSVKDNTGETIDLVKIIDENGNEVYVHSDDAVNLGDNAGRGADRDNTITADYGLLKKQYAKNEKREWLSLGISVAAWGGTFIPALAGDRHWQDKQRSFEQLFMHGNAVTVSSAEAVALLEVITQALPATLDPKVKSFLF